MFPRINENVLRVSLFLGGIGVLGIIGLSFWSSESSDVSSREEIQDESVVAEVEKERSTEFNEKKPIEQEEVAVKKPIVENAGVLGALRDGSSDGIGELTSKNLGSKGIGLGGGGTANGLGGLGTKGRGVGASGYGSGSGYGSIGNYSSKSAGHFTNYGVNKVELSTNDNLSTFSIDVDTASYTLARRQINEGKIPNKDGVRVEEFVNYLPYHYAPPKANDEAPFAVHMEASPNPFLPGHHIMRVGIKGKNIETERRPLHLTFLVDVSGSMNGADRLPLAVSALRYLVNNLHEDDTVAIATYAGRVAEILPPTSANERSKIEEALLSLNANGSTAMNSGIDLAYKMASTSYEKNAENRVIVLSDGDANVGPSSHVEILATIKDYAERGITLSTIGFGVGNYRDTLMEQLANKGDGNNYYIDSYLEAKRVFGTNIAGTLETIAKDVKIQVEFDPKNVHAYRLIGYENRDIADVDFRNDKVDAGEIGSGHEVTAVYDLVLADNRPENLAKVSIRAKPPGADAAAEEWVTEFPGSALHYEFEEASAEFRLAVGMAGFAELLRESEYMEELTWVDVEEIVAEANRGIPEDKELLKLIKSVMGLEGIASR